MTITPPGAAIAPTRPRWRCGRIIFSLLAVVACSSSSSTTQLDSCGSLPPSPGTFTVTLQSYTGLCQCPTTLGAEDVCTTAPNVGQSLTITTTAEGTASWTSANLGGATGCTWAPANSTPDSANPPQSCFVTVQCEENSLFYLYGTTEELSYSAAYFAGLCCTPYSVTWN